MQIEIDTPRPGLLLTMMLVGGSLLWWQPWNTATPLQASVVQQPMAQQTATSSSSASEEQAANASAPAMPYGQYPIMPMMIPVPMYYGMPMTPNGAAPSGFPSAFAAQAPQQTEATQESEEQRVQREEALQRKREEQAVLNEREALLRASLESLTAESRAIGADPAQKEEFTRATRSLALLLQDKTLAEATMLQYYRQEIDAEQAVARESAGLIAPTNGLMTLNWPVQPSHGISAYFEDPSYKERFKRDHHAIDIPTFTDTSVLAAAEGIVTQVVNNGKGFNYVTVSHPNGLVTLYGHLRRFSVKVGDRVAAGQELGKSGGRPGDDGAGLSTGPHLHLAVYLKGKPVDPLQYLPSLTGGES